MSEALIVGCGYTGTRLGRRLLEAGHSVTGTTRSAERATRLAEAGIRPLLVDLTVPEDVRKLEEEAPDVCFYLVPPLERPPRGGATDGGVPAPGPRDGGDDGGPLLATVRALRRAPLEAFVYGSSTSVYGDRGGSWVDETAVPAPDSPAGRARLASERALLRAGWEWDCRPRIGRIAGIYGPGRTLRRAIGSGRYHVVEGVESWTNRIHVDDLAAALAALWREGRNGRVYNLSDGHPHRSADFARLVAELCGLELTVIGREEAEARYSETRLARKLGSKRVSNRRLRQELGVVLRYPSYEEGVPAALREEGVLG